MSRHQRPVWLAWAGREVNNVMGGGTSGGTDGVNSKTVIKQQVRWWQLMLPQVFSQHWVWLNRWHQGQVGPEEGGQPSCLTLYLRWVALACSRGSLADSST